MATSIATILSIATQMVCREKFDRSPYFWVQGGLFDGASLVQKKCGSVRQVLIELLVSPNHWWRVGGGSVWCECRDGAMTQLFSYQCLPMFVLLGSVGDSCTSI